MTLIMPNETGSHGGGAAIVLARPTVVAHSIAPIVAGATGFTTRRFFRLAAAGALIWAVAFSLGGIAVGRLWRMLAPSPAALVVVGAAGIGVVGVWRLRRRRSHADAEVPDPS